MLPPQPPQPPMRSLSPQNFSYPGSYMKSSPISSMPYSYPYMAQPYRYGGYAYPSSYRNMGAPSTPVPASLNTANIRLGGVPGVSSSPVGTVYNQSSIGISNMGVAAAIGATQQARTIGIQKGYSQIQYIPYQSYYIDYEEREFVQNILVPIQRRVRDYYAVEHVVDYVPKQYEQTIVEYVPQEKMSEKLYYIPVQTEIIHLPQSQKVIQGRQQITTTKQFQGGVVTRPTQQTTITNQTLNQRVVQGQPQPVINRPAIQNQTLVHNVTQAFNQTQVAARPISQTKLAPGSIDKNIVRNLSPQPAPINPLPLAGQLATNLQQGSVLKPPITTQTVVQGPALVSGGAGQFTQTQQVQLANQALLQRQKSIPDSANIQYMHSTRTQRKLTSQQIKKMGLSAPGIISGSQAAIRSSTQPGFQRGPIVGNLPGQPLIQRSQSISSQPGQPGQPALQRMASLSSQQGQPQPVSLMKNDKVDLADSEHIDITKSKFAAQYATTGNTGQPTSLGTNAVSQSAFSFKNEESGNTFGRMESIKEVNRTSGASNAVDPNNRISGGSVFDYDRLGDY